MNVLFFFNLKLISKTKLLLLHILTTMSRVKLGTSCASISVNWKCSANQVQKKMKNALILETQFVYSALLSERFTWTEGKVLHFGLFVMQKLCQTSPVSNAFSCPRLKTQREGLFNVVNGRLNVLDTMKNEVLTHLSLVILRNPHVNSCNSCKRPLA